MSDEPKTVVIFRRFKGVKKKGHWPKEVIALFPLIPEASPGSCLSYMRVGQHGAASLSIMRDTKQARLSEPDVQELKKELEAIGYVLEVRVRMPHWRQIDASRKEAGL